MAEERLQKVMAQAGVASRRACEQLIADGRVRVDGETVTTMGIKVDPRRVHIEVDGRPVQQTSGNIYIKLFKPRDILSDFGGDARGRSTVLDLLDGELRHRAGHIFPVGRLDLNSEGLMLLTDDGALAHKLTHPRFEHPKTYYVLVEERPPYYALNQLRKGIELPDGYRTAPARVDIVDQLPQELELGEGKLRGVWLRFILREGKKRQIRQMTNAVLLPTQRLVRWSIGSLTLAGLKTGDATELSRAEVTGLHQMINAKPPRRGGKGGAADAKATNRRRKRTHGKGPSRPLGPAPKEPRRRSGGAPGRSSGRPSGRSSGGKR